jgi:hypothetical protein
MMKQSLEVFVLNNAGSGYATGDIVVVNGNGSGAVVRAIAGAGGRLIGFNIINPGSGYNQLAPSSVAVNSVGGLGANVTYVASEFAATNGPAKAKYLTKIIELAEEYRSDRAHMYLDICMPPKTDILVYYRATAPDDDRSIQDVNWVLATENSKRVTGATETVQCRFEMPLAYTANGVSFDEASKVQCKIVLLSSDGAVIPSAKNMQVITTV